MFCLFFVVFVCISICMYFIYLSFVYFSTELNYIKWEMLPWQLADIISCLFYLISVIYFFKWKMLLWFNFCFSFYMFRFVKIRTNSIIHAFYKWGPCMFSGCVNRSIQFIRFSKIINAKVKCNACNSTIKSMKAMIKQFRTCTDAFRSTYICLHFTAGYIL